jgi:hypothetical protein
MAQEMHVSKHLLSLLCLFSASLYAENSFALEDRFHYPFYVGAALGFGSTTWYGLVPSEKNQNVAIKLSAPTMANEGGPVWTTFVGYELNQHLAIEANYQHYPSALLTFDEVSLYSFENGEKTTLSTETEVVSIMAKLMVDIGDTSARIFSSIGIADTHRADILSDTWFITPSFGAGINYTFSPHMMAELNGNYIAGYGDSEINPVNDFIPFLYSISLRAVYRF